MRSLVVVLICCFVSSIHAANYLSEDNFEELYFDYLLKRGNANGLRSSVRHHDSDSVSSKMSIKMPGVSPQKHDSYICTSLKMPKEDTYIVGFTPKAEMNTAHHMLMFGCSSPFSKGVTWNCGEMSPVCASGPQRIMYAWGRNAPKLSLPKGVGFKAGGDTDVNYVVLQVHYGNVEKFANGLKDYSGVVLSTTFDSQKYLAGIYILADGWSSIPPHKSKWHIDTSCEFDYPMKIYPFAFRVHAHKLGDVVSGYRVRDGKWTLIGKGDPQRPQAFYSLKKHIDIAKNDDLVARCTYSSMTRDTVTHIGATMKDEMCNFYIMYFYDSHKYNVAPPSRCGSVGSYENVLYSSFPHGSDIQLPGGHPKMDMGKTSAMLTERSTVARPSYQLVGNLLSSYTGLADIRQICAVDITADQKEVVVFHRGNRAWGRSTFDKNNILDPSLGRIKQSTLLWVDIKTHKVTKKFGEDLFYLPHGLTIDRHDNLWITDVGSHQVFKFKPGDKTPVLTLGQRLKPGTDSKHFCKPTDVAVEEDGSFFVSDGYCNNRILKFSSSGKVISTIDGNLFKEIPGFPSPLTFAVPHSLALDTEGSALYVADRENMRVLQFNSKTGQFTKEFVRLDNAIYAVAFTKKASGKGGLVHLVTYPSYDGKSSSGLTYDSVTGSLVTAWKPHEGFEKPHDLAAARSGNQLFVVELDPPRLWQFNKQI